MTPAEIINDIRSRLSDHLFPVIDYPRKPVDDTGLTIYEFDDLLYDEGLTINRIAKDDQRVRCVSSTEIRIQAFACIPFINTVPEKTRNPWKS